MIGSFDDLDLDPSEDFSERIGEDQGAEPPGQIAELLRIIGGSHAQAGTRALCFRLA